MKDVNIVKLVTHFFEDDEDQSGDYAGVDLYINDKMVKSFGDYYHDKGLEKAEAWVDCIRWIIDDDIKVERENISDVPD